MNACLSDFRVVNPTLRTFSAAEARIAQSSIRFNNLSAAELGYPENVRLLISSEGTTLAIQACDKDDPCAVPFMSGASSDTAFFENHRSTICFLGHRIATCLYRTPMGSCIEKKVAFYIPHNLKIIKYAQRSLLPSPGANGRCFFCLQRKEASVKWQFFG